MNKTSQIALKEWDVVVRALRDGRQDVILRKGGVSDAGGVFALKEREFFLFPTWEHQSPNLLNPAAQPALATSRRERPPVGQIMLDTYAEVENVRVVSDVAELASLSMSTVWSRAYIDQRLAYKPENPLYLVRLKVHRLARPHLLRDDGSYAGCVSWVPLKETLETA